LLGLCWQAYLRTDSASLIQANIESTAIEA